jgi:hypothetical protein
MERRRRKVRRKLCFGSESLLKNGFPFLALLF